MIYQELEPQTFSESLMNMEGISAKSVEEHMKLYQGYIKKYNEVTKKLSELTEDDYTNANQVYSTIRALKIDLTFAWGGVVNHEIYFGHLGGKGGTPEGMLLTQLEKDFGSFEGFIKDIKATGLAARGWVWLAWDDATGRLFNYLGDAQNTYPVWGATPILALDVYEHAYFMDYGTGRAAYIDAFLKNVDWEVVQDTFEGIMGVCAFCGKVDCECDEHMEGMGCCKGEGEECHCKKDHEGKKEE